MSLITITEANDSSDEIIVESDPISARKVMPYKNMNYKKYVAGTLTLYGIAILVAVFMKDVMIIFQYLLPVSTISIAFVIPGALYFKADK